MTTMTKSELIERLCLDQSHLPPRDVEFAVNTVLDRMRQALIAGDKSKSGVLAVLDFVIECHEVVVTLRPVIRLMSPESMYHTLSRVDCSANGSTSIVRYPKTMLQTATIVKYRRCFPFPD